MKSKITLLLFVMFGAWGSMYGQNPLTHGSMYGNNVELYSNYGTGDIDYGTIKTQTINYKIVTIGEKTWAWLKTNDGKVTENADWGMQLRYRTAANAIAENNFTYASRISTDNSTEAFIKGITSPNASQPYISFFAVVDGYCDTERIEYDKSISNSVDINDNTAPILDSVEKKELTNNTVRLFLTVTDIDDFFYYITDGDGIEEISFNNTYDLSGLTVNETYTIKVKAIDFSGNESEEKEISFTVNGRPDFDANDNLALNKAAMNSCSSTSNIPNDGNKTNGLECRPSENLAWWYFDLGYNYNLDKIIVIFNDCRPRKFLIHVADDLPDDPADDSKWRLAAEKDYQPNQAPSGEEIIIDNFILGTHGKYIRIKEEVSGTYNGLGLREFEVYGLGYYDGEEDLMDSFTLSPGQTTLDLKESVVLQRIPRSESGTYISSGIDYSWSITPSSSKNTLDETTGLFSALEAGTYIIKCIATQPKEENDDIVKETTATIIINPFDTTDNLALNKAAMNSCSSTSNIPNDGNKTNGLECRPSENLAWWYFDLGYNYNLDKIIVIFNDCRPRKFLIHVADDLPDDPADDSKWRLAAEKDYQPNQAPSGEEIIIDNFILGTHGKYIRIKEEVSGTYNGLGLREFEVYGLGYYDGEEDLMDSFTLSPGQTTLDLKESVVLQPIPRGESGTYISSGIDYSWSIAPSSRNTINEDGVFEAFESGIFTITCTAIQQNKNITASSEITINNFIESTNLALNKPTNTSINQNQAEGPVASTPYSWESGEAGGDDAWWYVDLGDNYLLTEIIIKWTNAGVKEGYLQVRNDETIGNENEQWTTIYTFSSYTGGIVEVPYELPSETNGRYVRFKGKTRYNTGWGYGFSKFEVYGSGYSNTATWIGSESEMTATGWIEASNWKHGLKPSKEYDVIISASAASFPVLTSEATVNTITFEPSAEIGNQHLLNYENAIVKYNLAPGRWHMLTAPKNAKVNDFYIHADTTVWVKKFTPDAATEGWQYYTSRNDNLPNGEGFAYWIKKIEFGQPNTTIEVEVGKDELAKQVITREIFFNKDDVRMTHFALVGNPFMTTINFDDLTGKNPDITQNYMVWNGTGFEGYTPTGPWGTQPDGLANISETNPSKYIAPLQAFFVELDPNKSATQSSTNIVFDIEEISDQATTGEGILKSAKSAASKLNIVASYEGAPSVLTFIANKENAQSARKIRSNISNIPDIYTLAKDNTTALGAQFIDTDNITVPLGVFTAYSGDITITFTGMDTYDANIKLIDKANNNLEINLTGESETYTFNHTPDTNGEPVEDRFSIAFAPKITTGIEDEKNDYISVFAQNNAIHAVSATSDPISQIAVYDIHGNLIYENKQVNIPSYTIKDVHVPASNICIVRLITEKKSKNIKLFMY